MALFPPFTHSETGHSASAGLRWQMADDRGWSATYERLGIKGTLADQAVIVFMEIQGGEFLNNSRIEVFLTPNGQVEAKRPKSGGNEDCFYIGQIQNMPTLLDQGLTFEKRTSPVSGSYTCEVERTHGEWKGTIFW